MSPDPADMARLFVRAGPRLKRCAARLGIPADEAEDLVQDAWVVTIGQWEKLENPEAWLVRTVFFLGCMYHRRRRRRRWLQVVEAHLLEALAPLARPPQERADLLRDLATLCALLARRDSLLLHLRYHLGLTCEETAARLGCCPGSVGKLTQRALERVRQRLSAAKL